MATTEMLNANVDSSINVSHKRARSDDFIIRGVTYKKGGYSICGGDFSVMIHEYDYADTVFVFMDNVQDSNSFIPGGGSAIIRNFSSSKNAYKAVGVPTGWAPGIPFETIDDDQVLQVIDDAFLKLATVVLQYGYRKVVFPCDASDPSRIGVDIFRGEIGDDVVAYISSKFSNLHMLLKREWWLRDGSSSTLPHLSFFNGRVRYFTRRIEAEKEKLRMRFEQVEDFCSYERDSFDATSFSFQYPEAQTSYVVTKPRVSKVDTVATKNVGVAFHAKFASYPWMQSRDFFQSVGSVHKSTVFSVLPEDVIQFLDKFPMLMSKLPSYPKNDKYNYHNKFPEWGGSGRVQMFSSLSDERLSRYMIAAMLFDPRLRYPTSINNWVTWFEGMTSFDKKVEGTAWVDVVQENLLLFCGACDNNLSDGDDIKKLLKNMVLCAEEKDVSGRGWVRTIASNIPVTPVEDYDGPSISSTNSSDDGPS